MKNLLKASLLVALVLLMGACQEKGNDAYPYQTKYLPVVLDGAKKWSILNVENGEVAAKDAFETAPSAVISDMFYVMNKDYSFDYYNIADVKHPVNKQHYASATEFSADGFAIVSMKGKPMSIINTKCEVVAQLKDSIVSCSMFNRGLAVAQFSSGKYGYINTKGETVIAPEFDNAQPFEFCDYTFVATQGESTGQNQPAIVNYSFIDKTGKVTFKTNSTMYGLGNFRDDVILAQPYGKDTTVCLNIEGKEVANPWAFPDTLKNAGYAYTLPTGNDLYTVTKGTKMGVVDKNAKVLIPVKYDNIINVTPDRYLVSESKGIYILVDQNGKQIGKAKVQSANGNPAGLAQRGYIEVAGVADRMLQQLDPQGFMVAHPMIGVIPIAKGATFASLNQMLTSASKEFSMFDPTHPEALEGNNTIVMGSSMVVFAGPIVSKAADGSYTVNANTPVNMVVTNQNFSAYDNKTEQQIVDLMALNIGKVGFVSQGKNFFTSANGTAVALGYADGVLSMIYYMDATKATPIPCKARK